MRTILMLGLGLLLGSLFLGGMFDPVSLNHVSTVLGNPPASTAAMVAAMQKATPWVVLSQSILMALGLGLLGAVAVWYVASFLIVMIGDLVVGAVYLMALGVRALARWAVLRPRESFKRGPSQS